MIRNFILIVLIAPFILLGANSNFGTIATGSKQGTYIQIGKDISNIFKKYKIDLKVMQTAGSLDNMDIIMGKKEGQNASWAIVQTDVLKDYEFSYFKDSNLKDELYNKIKIVLPLYSEHIHVIAKKGNGKKIGFQKGSTYKVGIIGENSGANISARVIENVYGIYFKYQYFTFKEALKALQNNSIDILIDVIALPSNKYKNQKGIELVTLPPNRYMDARYQKTVFSKAQYGWLDQNTRGYKVPSIIITNKIAPQDKFVEIFLKAILKQHKELKQNAHPKWKEIFKNIKYIYDKNYLHPVTLKVLHRKR